MQIPQLPTSIPKPGILTSLLPTRREPAADLISVVEKYLDKDAVAEIYRAYTFGAEAHEGQSRRSGEPYIVHPLAVARILAEMRLDSRSIIAAILHDVIEDTGYDKSSISEKFGDDVAALVDGVSKIGQIEFESREEREAKNFRKMLLAMSRDIRVILIKLADRIHNMRTLDHMPQDKRLKIARQTLEIYAPIANRLGMYHWSRELEDLSFKHQHPKRYRAIAKTLKKRQGNRKSILKKIHQAIENQLQLSDLAVKVMGREKNVYSIYRKMQRKRSHFDDIKDIYAFRLIVDNIDNCYRTLGVIHSLYKPIPKRFKDYIAIPKINGYQSLHTVVFGTFGESFEVQIRTEEMNRIAEAGVASHWLYKADNVDTDPGQLAQQWLLDLLDSQKETGNPGEFLEHLKIDLFPDEVYVFTPKGDIKKLPQGATALDFAYAVHSDIGNRCVGGKINGQPAPLHAILHSGDHVEVLVSRTGQPSPTWLKFVVTGKARVNIRGFLKKQRTRDSVKLGKRLLERELKRLGIQSRRIKEADKDRLLASLNTPNWRQLLHDIGLGKRMPNLVARQLVPDSANKLSDFGKNQPLAIDGMEGMLINYAKCCYPIPGDPIVGYLGSGRGINVHVSDCPNTSEIRKHPEKSVPISWSEAINGEFPVNIRVDAQNKPGVLARLATIIAEQNSNITSLSLVEQEAQHSLFNFTFSVTDRRHLAAIMRNLRAEDEVIRLTRMRG